MTGSNARRQRIPGEVSFPDNIPWLELWHIAGVIEDQDVRQCFTEAIWCLRAGALNAAIVMGWSAVMLRLRKIFESLPVSVRDAYKSRYARPGPRLDDGDFLRICRKLTLFDLSDRETAEKDSVLAPFHQLRITSAHSTQTVDPKKVALYLHKCGTWFFVSPPNMVARFANATVVLELAREQKINQRLNDTEIKQVLDFVLDDQASRLADNLLDIYLQHAPPSSTEEAYVDEEEHRPEASGRMPDQYQEWSNVDANLYGLWNETYRRLDLSQRISLLDRLVNEFAEVFHCRPMITAEQIDLAPRDDDVPLGVGHRNLSELASLLVWKQELEPEKRPPEKYRNFFYACFAMSPGELVSLSDDMKRDLLIESPQEYAQMLKEAF